MTGRLRQFAFGPLAIAIALSCSVAQQSTRAQDTDSGHQSDVECLDAFTGSYVWWDLRAHVRYNDGSETDINTSDISYSDYEVRMAARDANEFARYKIRQKAIFPCDITSGPSGTVRVGNTLNGVLLGKDRKVADVAKELTTAHPVERTAKVSADQLLTRHQVYAPPLASGQWRVVASHVGTATLDISVEPIGNAQVVGQVRYFNVDNQRVVQSFTDSVTVRTGNAVANVEVRLRGNPTGSSCWVTVR